VAWWLEFLPTDQYVYGFNSRHYQIFGVVVVLERGALSLVSLIEELLEWKNIGSGLKNPDK
jgi:hypothetical protein